MAKNSVAWTHTPEEEEEILSALKSMEKNSDYTTDSRYVGNAEKYPDHQITFAQWHMQYLKKFPAINPRHYIANLRLMTKTKVS